MKILKAVAFICAVSLSGGVSAIPISLSLPTIYDNVGGDDIYGQTFIAEATQIAGIRWYIGRPDNEDTPTLDGAADLVLYSLASANPAEANPAEIGRTQIQVDGQSTEGLNTFLFDSMVATPIGASYFIGIDTPDLFGLGLGDQYISTYEGGYEARISDGVFEFASVNPNPSINSSYRDTSFEIITQTSSVPIPGTAWLIGSALLGLGAVTRKKA